MSDLNLTKTIPSVRWASFQLGDSLRTFALRELGDAARWTDIVQLNKLKPPYVADPPDYVGSSYATPGRLLKIPALTGAAVSAVDPDSVFGSDLALTSSGQLTASGGDFALVSGRANLKQALGIRIGTDPGELIYHPTYGCKVKRLLGQANGPAAAALAAQYVKSSLESDGRVERATNAAATVKGDALVVTAKADVISGSSIDIARTF